MPIVLIRNNRAREIAFGGAPSTAGDRTFRLAFVPPPLPVPLLNSEAIAFKTAGNPLKLLIILS